MPDSAPSGVPLAHEPAKASVAAWACPDMATRACAESPVIATEHAPEIDSAWPADNMPSV